MTNKLNVLIVEDDENDCKALAAEVNANADKLCLAGVSKSSHDALAFIRNHSPHAVILDLELQEGNGDGMDLLDKLRSTLICPKPYVVVNTNCASKITRDTAKMMGADYTFAKWQKGYSPKMVINQLLLVMPAILGCEEEPPAPLTEGQLENKMRDFVQDEFNKLGVNVKNVGYGYLVDAVILAAKGENQNWVKIIGDKIGKNENGVTHAMQYAINNTWSNADINDLQKYYTAPLRKDKFVPTINEFVFFYKQKLISYINK
ncbi:MAG: response regulator [Clostridia bacterium]|nr:response regulator [Clostridia bacterium]